MWPTARLLDKAGTLGTVTVSMGCAACFPVLGSLGASIGMGFLAGYEGVILNQLLPGFALFALIVNSYQWGRHARPVRGLLSLLGPLAVLLTLYPFWKYGWSTYLFYGGLILMLAMSLFELLQPANSCCSKSGI